MGILAELGVDALVHNYFDRHPRVALVCLLVTCLMALACTIWGWWEKREALRRIRRAIGQRIETESELTSLSLWMKVEEEEERLSA